MGKWANLLLICIYNLDSKLKTQSAFIVDGVWDVAEE
jgi:hypothetical protein